MRGRPQVPSRFVGGPLRGPPPPKGWNFFIVVCFVVRSGRGAVSAAIWLARRGLSGRREVNCAFASAPLFTV